MGKLPEAKTKKDSYQAGTKVKKVSSVEKQNKRVSRCYQKRLSMLRRRISVLLEEKESWEVKNQEIIDNFKNEKMLNAELNKDVLYWQRMYHEAVMSQNGFKVKQTDSISSCLREIKAAFPHLVGLSDAICRNQIRLTNLLNTSKAENENNLPRAFGGDCKSSDLSKRNEKRMKQHKVGPMVKGVLIQKPTIRLERVMLQQPQDQEPTNNDLEPERDVLTPIVEENEQNSDLHLEQISMLRRRKRRLGTGERWRMRKQQEKLEKEQEMGRKREKEEQRRSVSDSSDSEDQMPVIRLQRVTGLLLPNLLEVDRGRSSGGVAGAGEDPQEGCSWMHINPMHSTKKQEKRKPKATSTSDSEESDALNAVDKTKVRKKLSDSLCNTSFALTRKGSSTSSTVNTSIEASESSVVEPDSTNNIDVVFVRDSSVSDSLGMDNSLARSNVASATSLSQVQRVSVNNSKGSAQVTPLASAESSVLAPDQRRSISSCYSSTPITSPNVEGKRVRKPKIHLYPGEDSASTNSVSKTKKGKPNATSSSNKAVKSRSSVGTKKMGKSSVKKNSIESTRTSVDQRLTQDIGEIEGRNSRRIKGPITYKEPPANRKMRRT